MVRAGHREASLELDPQSRTVRHARRIRREARVVGQARVPYRRAQRGELGVVARGHRHRDIRRAKGLVRRDARVGIAHPIRRNAGGHIGGRLVHQRSEHAREQVHVHALAAARALPGAQRGQDPDRRVQARDDVHQRDAHLVRLASGSPVTLISPPAAWAMKS